MAEPAAAINRPARWAEFGALYIGAPLAIAVLLPPRAMFAALFALTVAGLVLLWRTGGFEWRSLLRGRVPWGQAALMGAAVVATGLAILSWRAPEAIFGFARTRPDMLAMVWVLYPFLSALPQELIFRPLFFHRFGGLFADRDRAVAVNAAVFALAHLMYWSVVVGLMTLAGGWLFARAYLHRGFLAAWVLHAIAGNLIFAVGMGVYFYSGNVTRPF